MVHPGFRQHGVVFDFGFTQRRNVVRDENEFRFPRAEGFENRLVPELLKREREKETRQRRVPTRRERRRRDRRRRRKNKSIGPPKSWTLEREKRDSINDDPIKIVPCTSQNASRLANGC